MKYQSTSHKYYCEGLKNNIARLFPLRHSFCKEGITNLKSLLKKYREHKKGITQELNPPEGRVLSLPKNTPFYLSSGGVKRGGV